MSTRLTRRAIVALHLIIEHNQRQYQAARGYDPRLYASELTNPTGALLFSQATGQSAYNEFLRQYPGLDMPLTHPSQITNIVNALRAAGLLHPDPGKRTRDNYVLRPTEAALDFLDRLRRRFGNNPLDWPGAVEVDDTGRPIWPEHIAPPAWRTPQRA
jgi:hypothetical protein